jgi:hypothetical protein
MSPPATAAQLSERKGFSRRGEARWTARATTSLPVPESPSTRTENAVSATRSISFRTFPTAAERPMISGYSWRS